MTYQFADWQTGARPPKGFDVADAIAFGWGRDGVQAMLRAAVCDKLPAFPVEADTEVAGIDPGGFPPTPEPEPGPAAVTVAGVDGVARIPRVQDIEHGSEVYISRQFANALELVCGGKVVRADGGFWAWGPTAWKEIPEQKLRLGVHQFDGATVQGKSPIKIGKRMIDGIISEAGTILSEPLFFSDPTVGLNATSGVICIGSDGAITMRGHDPDDRFRFTIPARFDTAAKMDLPAGSLLHTLVHGAFRGDPDEREKINLIGEILGAAAFGMATRLPKPKAFVLLGETANNGKSTIASLVERLLPEDAVSHIPPSAYEDERRIVNLAGKAANVADELSASAIAGETFKNAVTGDPIEGRDVYRSAMTFIPRAIHVFTTNTLPRFNGGLDRGLQRRLVVLRFNREIPDNEIIADIADRIRSDEMDLLLRFAVAGAQRLTMNRGYTIPSSSKEALQGWLLLDPVNEWFESRVRATLAEPVGGWPTTGKLFLDFKAWAIEQGHSERFLPPVNTFSQRLKAMPGVQVKRRSSGSVASGVMLLGVGETSPLDDPMMDGRW